MFSPKWTRPLHREERTGVEDLGALLASETHLLLLAALLESSALAPNKKLTPYGCLIHHDRKANQPAPPLDEAVAPGSNIDGDHNYPGAATLCGTRG